MSKLVFKGAALFRARVVFATLTGRALTISDIRSTHDEPGLKDYEVSLLRLIEKITNGSSISINETGTKLVYRPGIIIGGEVTHECGNERGLGYFIEALLLLGPFGKVALVAKLIGVTNLDTDINVDTLRAVALPILGHFGVDSTEIKLWKRGAAPGGGGEVRVSVGVVRALRPAQIVDEGKICRIRGVAYTTRVAPQIGSRMADTSREMLAEFSSDVWINTDHYKGREGGMSPGFGLTLFAESSTGIVLSAQATGDGSSLPEDTAAKATELLLAEVCKGGCVPSLLQAFVFSLMVLGPEDVSRVRVGPLTQYSIEYLRLIHAVFGKQFLLRPDAGSGTVLASCMGAAIINYSRRVA